MSSLLMFMRMLFVPCVNGFVLVIRAILRLCVSVWICIRKSYLSFIKISRFDDPTWPYGGF